MLCFITSDAAIKPAPLRAALQEATALSFNRITVDGDMSTNDTVLVLANGLAGNARIVSASSRDFAVFQEALNYVMLELAKMIVRDGEGVSRFVTVRVNGARSQREADIAARAVANSALVKTSWCGGDPNWGRIIDALGYSARQRQVALLSQTRPADERLICRPLPGRGVAGIRFAHLFEPGQG
jgi:glutamate N-acetyltransferase/amino-acid N-acetyltransferase